MWWGNLWPLPISFMNLLKQVLYEGLRQALCNAVASTELPIVHGIRASASVKISNPFVVR
jgi:hypothetical protein